ncbi:cadherin-like beta sandwich domain-containing protein [Candidatus Poriferisodalis sp.]|uniref:cadherin-like beta sandwich domain-containing protein n=1 Tax=Candidatus Poriferisodalis sp. TaxID=3101277 RepID=UPI003B5164E9
MGRLDVHAGWSAFGSLGETSSNSFIWNQRQYNIGALFATDDGKVQLSVSRAFPEDVVLRLGSLELTSTDAEVRTGLIVTAYIWTTGDMGWQVGDYVEASIVPVARDGDAGNGTFELDCDADGLAEGAALNCTLAYDGAGEPHWPAVALLSRPDLGGSVSLRGTDADVAIGTVTQLPRFARGEDEVAGERVEYVLAYWNGYKAVSSPVQFSIDVAADEIVEGEEAVWLSVGYAPENHGYPDPSRKAQRDIGALVASSVELPVAELSDVTDPAADYDPVAWLDDFELKCEARSVAEGGSVLCQLVNAGTEAAAWPLVALLHSSQDAQRALVAGSTADVEFGVLPDATAQLGNVWVGEHLIGYSWLDWSGLANPFDEKTFAVHAVDDSDWEPEEFFAIGVWDNGTNNIAGLLSNSVQFSVPQSDAKSSDGTLESLQVRALGSAEDLMGSAPVTTDAHRVDVGHEVVEVVVSPTPTHPTASATVGGQPDAPGGVAVGLAVGSNPVSVVVTAEDGSNRTYGLDVVRADNSGAGNSVVSVDGFTLSCPRSLSAATAEHTCVLANTADAANEWPVVAILNSSFDEHAAALTRVDPDQTAGIRLSDDPVADLDNYNYGYGELLPRTATGDYRVFHYERFDPQGTAAAGAERDVSLSIDDGTAIETSQVLYAALALSDATGLAELVANKIPITINPAAGTGHDDPANDAVDGSGPNSGQQESATSSRPLIHFTKEAHELFPRSLLWHSGSGDIDLDWTYTGAPDRRRHFYFDVVGLDVAHVEPSDLRFKVEAEPDKEVHQYKFCHRESKFQNPATDDGCHTVGVGVLPASGQLHMYIDGKYSHKRSMNFFLSDFPRHQIELSAEDTDSGLKIHRDVYIEPPAEAADCDVFPELNLERYNCLFLGELLPQSLETTQEYLDELPNLVQPSDNYRLVFSEEFEHCNDDDELDPAIWSIGAAPCKTDGENVSPCQHFTDGNFYMTAFEECASARTEIGNSSTKSTATLDTQGNVRFKYGYLEAKITIPRLAAHGYWTNLAVYLGNATRDRLHHHERYGIVVDNIEQLTTTHSTEIDLFEFLPGRSGATIHAHQYRNWFARYFVPELQPIVTHRNILFCYAGNKTLPRIYQLDTGRAVAGDCDSEFLENTPVTMTIGLEWTPRGYRSFLKIADFHDDWEITRKENIGIGYYPIQWRRSDGTVQWNGRNVAYEGSERDKFFEFLIPGDPNSVLEQAGISHVPASIYIGNSQATSTNGRSAQPGILIDYVRVFQPQNNYGDMDPVFQ